MIDRQSLLESMFNVVEPALAASAAPLEARAPLHRWLAGRPRAPWAGLELRLAGRAHIDAHQGFHSHDCAALESLIPAIDAAGVRGELLRHVLSVWSGSPAQEEGVIESVILEYDLAEAGPPAESVFVQFAAGSGSLQRRRSLQLRGVETLMQRCGLHSSLPALYAVLRPLPMEARLSHLGFMLDRAGTPVRLNIKDLPLAQLACFPADLGWCGNHGLLGKWIESLALYADRLNLCLELVASKSGPHRLGSRLGLECAVESRSRYRWQPLFDLLGRAGLADGARCDGILRAWPGADTPWSALGRWPTPLIAEDLRRGGPPAALERYISHVKLSLAGDALEAKAYLGFGVGAPRAAPAPAAPLSGAPPARSSLADVCERAATFLLDGLGQTRFWTDYPNDGCSDEWVSAYVGCALAGRAGGRESPALHELAQWLCRRQRPTGGWGFDAGRPADADSTVWALRLLAQLGMALPPLALAFLRRHLDPVGGIRTYLPSDALAEMAGSPRGGVGGWTSSHLCVTAAAAGVAGMQAQCCEILVRRQSLDGRWPAYWWAEDAYATALATEAIAAAPFERASQALDKAGRWAAERALRETNPSAFGDALLLRTLIAVDPDQGSYGDVVGRLVSRLLSKQRGDGSWAPSALLRHVQPDCILPDTRHCASAIVLDHRASFTTATVLEALDRLARMPSPGTIRAAAAASGVGA